LLTVKDLSRRQGDVCKRINSCHALYKCAWADCQLCQTPETTSNSQTSAHDDTREKPHVQLLSLPLGIIADTTATELPMPIVFVLLLQRMYVGLSDEEARRGMLEMKLGDCAQGLQQADLACTHDFSGSDIAVLAGHLLMLPVRLTQQAICFRYSIPNQTACCNVCDAYVDLAILRMTTTVPSYYTCCLHASHEQSLAGFASCAAKGCILRACDKNLRLQ